MNKFTGFTAISFNDDINNYFNKKFIITIQTIENIQLMVPSQSICCTITDNTDNTKIQIELKSESNAKEVLIKHISDWIDIKRNNKIDNILK